MNELREKMKHRLYLPGEEMYENKRKVWNAAIDRYPQAIAGCHDEEDVVAAVRYAAGKGLSVSIRGGGHHVAGTAICDGGLMIDLSAMRRVEVDEQRRVAFVQGGATLGDVDRESQKYGLATPTGTVSKTGIAGLALNGGIGYLRRKYGLTCDNIISARVVTADGNIVDTNEQSYPDLFWALKGGGGNFGVVTMFGFQLHPIGPEVLALDVMCDYEDVNEVLLAAYRFNQSAPEELTFNTTITQLPPVPFLPESLHHKKVVMITGMYVGDPEEGIEIIQPLRELAQPITDHSGVMTYNMLQQKLDAMVPETVPVAGTSLYFPELDDRLLKVLSRKIEAAPTPASLVQFWPLGGYMNKVASDATAFAIRDAGVLLLIDIMGLGTDIESCRKWADAVYSELLPISYNQSSYLNAIGVSETVTRNTFAGNYKRLVQIKMKYDPENIFRFNPNIDPTLAENI